MVSDIYLRGYVQIGDPLRKSCPVLLSFPLLCDTEAGRIFILLCYGTDV